MGKSLDEIRAVAGTGHLGLALACAITGDVETGRRAVASFLADAEFPYEDLYPMAVLYDWCHDLLAADEEAGIRRMLIDGCFKRMARRGIWRSFSYRIHRYSVDIGICAIALYHRDPFGEYALEFLKPHVIDAIKVLDDVFCDGEWPEGFDLNRAATGDAFRLMWALKTATGDDLMAASPHMRNAAQYIVYCSKPDCLVYPGGNNDQPALSDRDRETLLYAAAEFRDPYAQYFLNKCPCKLFAPEQSQIWRNLLWYDQSISEKPLDELPRSRIFRGHGLVIARSAWGWDAADKRLPASWISFRCGKYFGQECHYDNNHFEIYYKGELAIDSGRYDEDWGLERSPESILRSQMFNYYRRAIAHNTVLVYDPLEKMEMGVVNDGGQKEVSFQDGISNDPETYDPGPPLLQERRPNLSWIGDRGRWDTAEMLAYAGNNLFTYVCGDATKSYSERKMRSFVRQLFYVQPDLVVVFDRLVSTERGFRKTWLLHSIIEPRLHASGRFEIRYNGGRLACVPLLPDQRSIQRVGGAGKEFLVGDAQYACGPKASSGRRTPLHFGELPGAWRVEISPRVPWDEDYFLNVMLLTDKESKVLPEVTREDAGPESIGLSIALPYQRRVAVSFARGPKPSATLLIEDHARVLFDGAMPDSVVLEKGRI